MNTTSTLQKIPGYKRAIIGMVTMLLVSLVLSNVVLLKFERKGYLKNVRDNTIYELDEAAAFMVEPLLKY